MEITQEQRVKLLQEYMKYWVEAQKVWTYYEELGKQNGLVYQNNELPVDFNTWLEGYLKYCDAPVEP